jgi:glutamyl-tRNA synthetase
MSSEFRVRFAPSPTGYLHVGGARTALFNWLFARHHGGTFVLRIEDTDETRNTQEAVQVIFDGLRWLGLDWDEGPDGGAYGPYFQSQRNEIYARHAQRLVEAALAYTDSDGALRFRQPREPVTFEDLVCGTISVDRSKAQSRTGEPEPDMTIRRADGSWIFHFVNVVDDLEMGITHVIRGEDHLSNTPKHIELFRALGEEPPHYGHIPLILNKDGSKMSKRDKGASLTTYMEEGWVPEAVRNYLCLLGWSPKDDREKLDIEEVIELFDLKNVNRKNASFDIDKLLWLNAEYTRELDDTTTFLMSLQALQRAGYDLSNYPRPYIDAALNTCKGKVRIFSELPAYAGFYFTDDFEYDREGMVKYFLPLNRPYLVAVRKAFSHTESFDTAGIEKTMKATAEELGVKVKALVHPVRLACTGNTFGPSLYHLIEVLGKEKTLRRIDRAIKLTEFED